MLYYTPKEVVRSFPSSVTLLSPFPLGPSSSKALPSLFASLGAIPHPNLLPSLRQIKVGKVIVSVEYCHVVRCFRVSFPVASLSRAERLVGLPFICTHVVSSPEKAPIYLLYLAALGVRSSSASGAADTTFDPRYYKRFDIVITAY